MPIYFQKKYSDIKDSIFNEEGVKQMIEMQAKYETDKKRRNQAAQKKIGSAEP